MKIIKNVITAIGNQKLIKNLKENQINVLCNDISYREGILEFLEVNKNIDLFLYICYYIAVVMPPLGYNRI